MDGQVLPILVRDERVQVDTYYRLVVRDETPSDVSTLATLVLRGGTGTRLNSGFVPGTLDYTGGVDALDGTFYISATPTDSGADISMTSGSLTRQARSGEELRFVVGSGGNATVSIRCTAANGVDSTTYSITLSRARAAVLSDLTLTGFQTISQYRSNSRNNILSIPSLVAATPPGPRGSYGIATRQVGRTVQVRIGLQRGGAGHGND